MVDQSKIDLFLVQILFAWLGSGCSTNELQLYAMLQLGKQAEAH